MSAKARQSAPWMALDRKRGTEDAPVARSSDERRCHAWRFFSFTPTNPQRWPILVMSMWIIDIAENYFLSSELRHAAKVQQARIVQMLWEALLYCLWANREALWMQLQEVRLANMDNATLSLAVALPHMCARLTFLCHSLMKWLRLAPLSTISNNKTNGFMLIFAFWGHSSNFLDCSLGVRLALRPDPPLRCNWQKWIWTQTYLCCIVCCCLMLQWPLF